MLAGIPIAVLFGYVGIGVIALGGITQVVGIAWAERLYRCPKCGKCVLRNRVVIPLKTYNHCPDCGWKTDIEWTD